MSLTINTNISSLIAQRNLNIATKSLNQSLERMSTGYKINHAADNAAGYSIASMWDTQISSLDVASDNATMGADLLTTAEDTYSLLTSHLQRIRDLTEQAANGTFGETSLKAIQSEVYARLKEVDRISANSEYNGIQLMSYIQDGDDNKTGVTSDGINLQVGLYANEDGRINLEVDLFRSASISGLFNNLLTTTHEKKESAPSTDLTLKDILKAAGAQTGADPLALNTDDGLKAFAAACANLIYDQSNDSYSIETDKDVVARHMLYFLDDAIDNISSRVTRIGAAQNRVTSALSAIDVQSQNIVSSLSTLRDTDVASESSNYIKSQILQQATATLLSTANQTPSIALNLI